MSTTSDDEEVGGGDLFQEPADYYQPEKQPTFVTHRMLNGEELHLRLVGHNPLWVGAQKNISYLLTSFSPSHFPPNFSPHLPSTTYSQQKKSAPF